MIRGTCRFCGRAYRVGDRFAGRTGTCKTCGAEVTVPGEPVQIDDGLPPEAEPEPAAPEAPRPQAARPQARLVIQSVDASAPPPEEAEQEAPSPAEERQAWSSHDSRSRFEPEEGPTTLDGNWLDEEGEGEADEADAPRVSLATDYLITDVTVDEDIGRPRVVVVASLALMALAISFCVYIIRSGPLGGVIGGIVVLLAGLSVIRLWIERWDGLVPGLLSCLGVLAIVVLSAMPRPGQPAEITLAQASFLVGALVVMTLLSVCAFRESCRDYFGT
jgi:hypothetical protein